MTAEQADQIIYLLEKIVSNTEWTKEAISNLHYVRNLDDIHDKLDEVITAIENISN